MRKVIPQETRTLFFNSYCGTKVTVVSLRLPAVFRHPLPPVSYCSLLYVVKSVVGYLQPNRRVANVTTVEHEADQSFGELSGKKSSQYIEGKSVLS